MYVERETDSTEGAERERESQAGSDSAEPSKGLELTNCEIMT